MMFVSDDLRYRHSWLMPDGQTYKHCKSKDYALQVPNARILSLSYDGACHIYYLQSLIVPGTADTTSSGGAVDTFRQILLY